MSRKNNEQAAQIIAPYQHENHKRAVSRRDLLAQGFVSVGGYMAMPSMISLVSQRAMGQDAPMCGKESTGGMVPFICIDLAGGANIAGTNVIVGDRNGQKNLLPAGSYGTLGLAPEVEPDKTGVIDESLGLAFHRDSKMLLGIKERAGTAANFTDGALFCTSSGDDTRNNPHNPLFWIAGAGLGGQLVSLVGTSGGASGGRAAAPAASINAGLTPSRITAPADALGLVSKGKLATLLTDADVEKIMKATRSMSASKLKMFQAQDMSTQIKTLVECGYINSAEFLSKFTPASLDSATDARVTTAFTAFGTDPVEARGGTIAKLVLEGFVGAGVIEMGGYDYHGQGRATQDARDLAAGRMIGSILNLAAAHAKPVMIYVYTDGGVSSGNAGAGIRAFASDSGERSAAFALVYKPGNETRPEMHKRQVGGYKAGGSVDGTVNKISTSPENLSKAIVANYMALHGTETKLTDVVKENPFGNELPEYIAFKKMV